VRELKKKRLRLQKDYAEGSGFRTNFTSKTTKNALDQQKVWDGI
jgi:hypothetical protein